MAKIPRASNAGPTRSDAAAQDSVFDSTFICCSIYMFYLHPRSIPLKTAPLSPSQSPANVIVVEGVARL